MIQSTKSKKATGAALEMPESRDKCSQTHRGTLNKSIGLDNWHYYRPEKQE